MPDLLAHALIAYSLATIISWRYDWLSPAYVTVAMAGAFVPDLTKVRLIIASGQVESLVGLPFSWSALHTAGGALVALLVGVTFAAPSERRRVFGLLTLGASSHLLADALLLSPSGRSYAILWPLTQYHPPSPGLYLSTQPGPAVFAALSAIVVCVATRYRSR